MNINTSGKNVVQPLAGKRGGRDHTLLSESSPFHVREAFKTIRTNLQFTLATTSSKSFVIA